MSHALGGLIPFGEAEAEVQVSFPGRGIVREEQLEPAGDDEPVVRRSQAYCMRHLFGSKWKPSA